MDMVKRTEQQAHGEMRIYLFASIFSFCEDWIKHPKNSLSFAFLLILGNKDHLLPVQRSKICCKRLSNPPVQDKDILK